MSTQESKVRHFTSGFSQNNEGDCSQSCHDNFVTNAITAVIRVVKHPKLGPEDMILCTSHTYNVCYKALDSAVRRAKADIITIDISVPIRASRRSWRPTGGTSE